MLHQRSRIAIGIINHTTNGLLLVHEMFDAGFHTISDAVRLGDFMNETGTGEIEIAECFAESAIARPCASKNGEVGSGDPSAAVPP